MATIFGQRDYNVELGTGVGATIAAFGCAETAVASVLVNSFNKDTDPIRLNQALIQVTGYVSNGAGAFDILDWTAITKIYSEITLAYNNSYPSSPCDMKTIDTQLDKGFPVITGVSFNHNPNDTQASHYVEIYRKNGDGTYQMRDPWFKDDTVFNSRYAVNGMTVPQCILQTVSYNGVPTSPMAVITQKDLDQMRKDRDDNYNNFQAELVKNTQLTTDLKQEQGHSGDLLTQLEKLNNEETSTTSQLLDAQKALKPLQNTILALQNELAVNTPDQLIPTIKTLKASKVIQMPKPKSFAAKLKFLLS